DDARLLLDGLNLVLLHQDAFTRLWRAALAAWRCCSLCAALHGAAMPAFATSRCAILPIPLRTICVPALYDKTWHGRYSISPSRPRTRPVMPMTLRTASSVPAT